MVALLFLEAASQWCLSSQECGELFELLLMHFLSAFFVSEPVACHYSLLINTWRSFAGKHGKLVLLISVSRFNNRMQ